MTSYSTAICYGRLFTHHLETQKMMALHEATDNFQHLMTLDAMSQEDILWWISDLDSECAPITLTDPSVILCTVGSLVGGLSARGRQTIIETGFHTRYFELFAIFHALKACFIQKSDQHIWV